VIGRVVRGWRAYGLVAYLFGPGRANEHVDPRVVASWDGMPDRLQPPVTGVGARGRPRFDVGDLVAALTLPTQLAGVPLREPSSRADGTRPRGPVWHCSVRTAPGDRELTDTEWAAIAADILHRTGIAPHGDPGACRWVAVRHAADHIHIAAVLVRADTGRRVHPRNDYRRLREVCLAAEQAYGLTPTSPADGSATKATTRAEREQAARTGLSIAREQLRELAREAAVDSTDLTSFIQRLRATRMVDVEVRTSADGRRLVGYRLTRRLGSANPAERVWFSGATLAPDLSSPALQQRWDTLASRPPLTTSTRPNGEPELLPLPQQHRILTAAEEITRRAHAAFNTTNTLTTTGLTEPGTDYDTELSVLSSAVADVLDRLARIDHTRTLGAAADAFRLAAGRAPTTASTVAQSRWAPLARDLRLAARDLAHIGRLTTSSRAVATAALLLAVAGLIAEIAAWREHRGQPAASVAARRAHTALTQHRLLTHPPRPPAPTTHRPATAPTSRTTRPVDQKPRPTSLQDRPRPWQPSPGDTRRGR
jgi:hypothetical protein